MPTNTAGQILTVARIRPPAVSRGGSSHADDTSGPVSYKIHPSRLGVDEETLELVVPEEYRNMVGNKETARFKFTRVMEADATQQDIFQAVAHDTVSGCLRGFSGAIFTYGQTNSGKTWTVTGGEGGNEQGLVPRAIRSLFQKIGDASAAEGRVRYEVRASYVEIYEERVYDLLDVSNRDKTVEEWATISVLADSGGDQVSEGRTTFEVDNKEDALNLFDKGNSHRLMGETPANKMSSRSHAVFTLTISSKRQESGEDVNNDKIETRTIVSRCHLNIVDLAGSERMYKNDRHGCSAGLEDAVGVELLLGTDGKAADFRAQEARKTGREREGKNINLSLLTLEKVVHALKNPGSHVPYRESTLTSVLRESLGQQCRMVFVVTLSIDREDLGETVATCRFAQRCRKVVCRPIADERLDPSQEVDLLRREAAEMRASLQEKDDILRILAVEIEDRDEELDASARRMEALKAEHAFHTTRELTEDDKDACVVLVEALVDGSGDAEDALQGLDRVSLLQCCRELQAVAMSSPHPLPNSSPPPLEPLAKCFADAAVSVNFDDEEFDEVERYGEDVDSESEDGVEYETKMGAGGAGEQEGDTRMDGGILREEEEHEEEEEDVEEEEDEEEEDEDEKGDEEEDKEEGEMVDGEGEGEADDKVQHKHQGDESKGEHDDGDKRGGREYERGGDRDETNERAEDGNKSKDKDDEDDEEDEEDQAEGGDGEPVDEESGDEQYEESEEDREERDGDGKPEVQHDKNDEATVESDRFVETDDGEGQSDRYTSHQDAGEERRCDIKGKLAVEEEQDDEQIKEDVQSRGDGHGREEEDPGETQNTTATAMLDPVARYDARHDARATRQLLAASRNTNAEIRVDLARTRDQARALEVLQNEVRALKTTYERSRQENDAFPESPQLPSTQHTPTRLVRSNVDNEECGSESASCDFDGLHFMRVSSVGDGPETNRAAAAAAAAGGEMCDAESSEHSPRLTERAQTRTRAEHNSGERGDGGSGAARSSSDDEHFVDARNHSRAEAATATRVYPGKTSFRSYGKHRLLAGDKPSQSASGNDEEESEIEEKREHNVQKNTQESNSKVTAKASCSNGTRLTRPPASPWNLQRTLGTKSIGGVARSDRPPDLLPVNGGFDAEDETDLLPDARSYAYPASRSAATATEAEGVEATAAAKTPEGTRGNSQEYVDPLQDGERHRALLTAGGFFMKHGRFGKPHMRFVWMSQDLATIMWRCCGREDVRRSELTASFDTVQLGYHPANNTPDDLAITDSVETSVSTTTSTKLTAPRPSTKKGSSGEELPVDTRTSRALVRTKPSFATAAVAATAVAAVVAAIPREIFSPTRVGTGGKASKQIILTGGAGRHRLVLEVDAGQATREVELRQRNRWFKALKYAVGLANSDIVTRMAAAARKSIRVARATLEAAPLAPRGSISVPNNSLTTATLFAPATTHETPTSLNRSPAAVPGASRLSTRAMETTPTLTRGGSRWGSGGGGGILGMNKSTFLRPTAIDTTVTSGSFGPASPSAKGGSTLRESSGRVYRGMQAPGSAAHIPPPPITMYSVGDPGSAGIGSPSARGGSEASPQPTCVDLLHATAGRGTDSGGDGRKQSITSPHHARPTLSMTNGLRTRTKWTLGMVNSDNADASIPPRQSTNYAGEGRNDDGLEASNARIITVEKSRSVQCTAAASNPYNAQSPHCALASPGAREASTASPTLGFVQEKTRRRPLVTGGGKHTDDTPIGGGSTGRRSSLSARFHLKPTGSPGAKGEGSSPPPPPPEIQEQRRRMSIQLQLQQQQLETAPATMRQGSSARRRSSAKQLAAWIASGSVGTSGRGLSAPPAAIRSPGARDVGDAFASSAADPHGEIGDSDVAAALSVAESPPTFTMGSPRARASLMMV